MTRIGSLLVQDVDGTGVVIVDESSGDEVFIPADKLSAFYEALTYFVPVTLRTGKPAVAVRVGVRSEAGG